MPPFFIVGAPRSGTTLLSVLLSNHSQVYIDGESVGISIAQSLEKYKRLFAHIPAKGQQAIFERVVKTSYKKRLEQLTDWEHLDEYPDLRALFLHSVEKRASGSGKSVWGDKTPELILWIPELLQVFPDARFIHVVRDARPNALSMWKRQYIDFQMAAQYWKDLNGRGLAYRQILGARQYRIFRYETLLKEPEKELRAICDFLGLPYEERMLDLGNSAATQSENAYVKNQVDDSKVDEWRKKLTPVQVRQVEQIAGDLMVELGYSLEQLGAPGQARSLSYGRQFWLRQKDLFKLLFKARRVQMINRQLVPVRLSVGRRLKNFVLGTIKHIFSDELIRIFKPLDR